jgi:urate oxidase
VRGGSNLSLSQIHLDIRRMHLLTQVMLEGDFEESYTEADNSRVVATDTSE